MDPWGGSHAEENALSFADAVAGDQKLREDHTKKRKKRLKGSEVVFNPEEHKEYVTGFRKRKLQRKREAHRAQEEKAKQSRLEERAQKRAEVRARLDLDRYMTSSDSEAPNEEVQNEEADVKVITNNGVSSVVTVAPFSINTDSDSEAEEPNQEHPGGRAASGSDPAASKNEATVKQSADRQPVKRQPRSGGTFSKLAQPVLKGDKKRKLGSDQQQRAGKKKKRKGHH